MANVLEYSKIFQPLLDKQVVQESSTGWMELNSGLVKYNGGDEVKLPSIVMDGLADYDRANGFVEGAIELSWQTHTLTQDRGRTFSIDAMDVDETNFVATAGVLMGEFQRQAVVPEIDAYRYSKLASLAINNQRSRDVAITDENILDELLQDLAVLEDELGPQNFVITLSPVMALKLARSAKDFMTTSKLAKGEASVDVQAFNEHPLVKAASKYLKSAFVFQDGKTAGQEDGGFADAAGAKDVNWIIAAKDAPIAIAKTDKVRVFNPDVNQKADAYKIDFRKYHDLWVPTHKLPKIYANVKPAE